MPEMNLTRMKIVCSLIMFFGTYSLVLATPVNGEPENTPEEKDSTTTDEVLEEVSFYDTSNIYLEDWNNNITFSYAKKEINPELELNLVDSLHGFAFPIEKETTSGFGRRRHSYHKGIDIPLKTGEQIVSAFDGKVRYAKYNRGGFGNLVIIRHVNGLETYYAHLSRIKVKPNQVVKAGELIGLGGCTGRSYSPHLHFEVRYKDKAFDPEKVFDIEAYCLKEESALVKDLVNKSKASKSTSHGHDHSHVSAGEGTTYIIRSGDSLSKVASKYGTSVDKLCRLNGLSRTSILQIGQRIRVK